MPTIRRPGSVPSDPLAPASAGPGAPEEHSLSHLEVPAETTPTWELEMLVSGAVLVGLFQLPPLINGTFQGLASRLEQGGAMMAATLYMLTSAVVYVLMAAFLVHLASRTYWVALVGLDSVYPSGIDWEKFTTGPISNEVLKRRVARLPALIEQVDNFCSVIFAFGFLVASVAAFSFLVVGVGTGLAILVSNLVLGHVTLAVLNAGIILSVLPLILLPLLDRRFGARLPPSSWLARLIRGYAVVNYRYLGMRIYGPIMGTLRSHLRRRVVRGIMIASLLGAMIIVFVQRTAATGQLSLNAYSFAPSGARQQTVSAEMYADQRIGAGATRAVPFIQSDMIRDPYVRLFIPYLPAEDNPVLARCPGTRAGAPDPRAAAAIACLARLHAVTLNGRPRPELDFRFYTDPQSGLEGILTYIAVSGLPKGRNVISLHPSPPPPGEESPTPSPDIFIPFWL